MGTFKIIGIAVGSFAAYDGLKWVGGKIIDRFTSKDQKVEVEINGVKTKVTPEEAEKLRKEFAAAAKKKAA